jgi:hypothetical protein
MVIDQNKLTQSQIEKISAPMELDLIAFFDILFDKIDKIIDNNRNKTQFELNKEIEDLFNETIV